MTTKLKPEFTTRLFSFYKIESVHDEFPKIFYNPKTGRTAYPIFEPTEPDKNTQNGLNVLHPQARKFLSGTAAADAIQLFRLAQPLQDELTRSRWQTEAPQWVLPQLKQTLHEAAGKYYFTIQIKNINAIIFPTRILAVYLEIEPGFAFEESDAVLVGKMILNTFYRRNNEIDPQPTYGTLINRIFPDERQQKSVTDRMQDNVDMIFTQALCGAAITLGGLVNSLVGNGCTSLMNNRFITKSYLETSWDGMGKAFSAEDYLDLVRLSRAENDRYLPELDDFLEKPEFISHTFENVAFALAGEGVACWIKPRPDQDFLQHQFRQRFHTIYLQLFLLALHQRYALVDLANRLDVATPATEVIKSFANSGEKVSLQLLDQIGQKLRQIRTQMASFYLRAFFHQPAVLTNHQQFYQNLHKVLGISELLTEVQQSTKELEFIIHDLHQRKADVLREQENENRQQQNLSLLREIGTLIREQQRASHNELILTLVVEGVAIPYYLYNFLAHAFNLPHLVSIVIALMTTITTIGYTVLKFRNIKD